MVIHSILSSPGPTNRLERRSELDAQMSRATRSHRTSELAARLQRRRRRGGGGCRPQDPDRGCPTGGTVGSLKRSTIPSGGPGTWSGSRGGSLDNLRRPLVRHRCSVSTVRVSCARVGPNRKVDSSTAGFGAPLITSPVEEHAHDCHRQTRRSTANVPAPPTWWCPLTPISGLG